ncbi:MAG: D-alanine--D-alanine ligase [Eubacteriales bacterium]|nr:D-alanine--D-alanine ligase [Eubacteriales bacterium]
MDTIGIFFGGKSTEHEVSRVSAAAVYRAIDKKKHQIVRIGITKDGIWKIFDGTPEEMEDGSWEITAEEVSIDDALSKIDFALPILHGAHGEDGTIQGLFEMRDMPYAGPGVLGSSLAMDKVAAKMVFEASGIPTCDFVLVLTRDVENDIEKEAARCEEKLPYPMFVKPANAGSSVGISKVHDHEELLAGLREAAKFDRRLIVEVGVNAREIETGVIGNDDPIAAGVGEIEAAHEFYDYDAKYSDDAKTVITVPAEVDGALREEIRKIAVKTFKALDLAGFSRVDFMVDRDTGKVYVNEVNTIPGFTKYSMFPTLWEKEGVPFTELLEKIIAYGYERHHS